jgi:hypothetical protein
MPIVLERIKHKIIQGHHPEFSNSMRIMPVDILITLAAIGPSKQIVCAKRTKKKGQKEGKNSLEIDSKQ